MWRGGLILFLLLSTAAGEWLCPCQFDRLLRRIFEGEAPDSPCEDHGPCRCQGDEPAANVHVRSVPSDDAQDAWSSWHPDLHVPALICSTLDLDLDPVAQPPPDGFPTHFLSAREIPCAFHMLRC